MLLDLIQILQMNVPWRNIVGGKYDTLDIETIGVSVFPNRYRVSIWHWQAIAIHNLVS